MRSTTRLRKSPRNFVLVHGAWHGGWCYDKLIPLLQAAGHRVFAPTLTGMGERAGVPTGPINCTTHIQDIVRLIQWEQLGDVVLCGHSYGGMVVGGVADAIPHTITALAFLDALVPENGRSALDFVADAQHAISVVQSAADGYWVPPVCARALNVNEADVKRVDALCTPQPLPTFCERLPLRGAHLSISRKIYIHASGWLNSAGKERLNRFENDENWTTAEIESGHNLMLDAPEVLAERLLSFAQ